MHRRQVALFLLPLFVNSLARADEEARAITETFERVSPALRVAKLTLESEDSRRLEMRIPGCVVSADGLTMLCVADEVVSYPRGFFKTIELRRPGNGAEWTPARIVGVNELRGLMFVAPVAAEKEQPRIDIAASREAKLAEPLIAVGLLDESMGHRPTFALARAGPPLGDSLALPGLPVGNDGEGTLLFGRDGALVGIINGRSALLPDDETMLDMPQGDRFMSQASATRASVLVGAVEFALRERRDWPEPWIGVAGLSVASADIREAYGLEKNAVALIVGAVVEGYPAATAGVRPKDFIVELDGRPIPAGATDGETLDTWLRRIKAMQVGAEMTLTLWRDGSRVEKKLKLVEGPTPSHRAARHFDAALGLTVRELVFEDRFYRRLDAAASGVVVGFLVQSGPAETAQLEDGDIVQKVDDVPTADLAAFRRVVEKRLAEKPPAIVFSVLRGTSQQVIARLELPFARQ